MTDKLQALVAHDNAQKALIASQAAEVARLEALVVSRVRASADAVVEIASQASEIERLRAHIERGHEIHERLTNFSSHSMEWDMALDEAIAYLSGDTP